jgi:hypothetical protein
MASEAAMNQPSGGGGRNVREEQVMYHIDPETPDLFTPRISVATTKASGKVEKTFRQFESSDMERVLDYENCVDAPADGVMMVGVPDSATQDYVFTNRHCCLRGNFVFYFDTNDVDDKSGPYSTYHAPPVGVIPLDNIQITFPPGGRRVFREHAHTEARNGYEFVVIHDPPELSDDEGDKQQHSASEMEPEKKEVDPAAEGEDGQQNDEPAGPTARPAYFLVAMSLGERSQWADAITSRSKVDGQPTMLRASYSTSRAGAKGATAASVASVRQDQDRKKKAGDKEGKGKNLFDGDDTEVNSAINEFGANQFSEVKWMDNFFENYKYYDAPEKCDQMEHWQGSIKKQLKAAVLEQYEYFVLASGEMTTMGKEVSSLKSLVETQMELLREMKDIDFAATLRDFGKESLGALGTEEGKENGKNGKRRQMGLFGDEESELSSVLDDLSSHRDDRFMPSFGRGRNQGNTNGKYLDDPAHILEVPTWLDDVCEEISAFVKESRYTDAIDLWTKAKAEVAQLFEKVCYVLVSVNVYCTCFFLT